MLVLGSLSWCGHRSVPGTTSICPCSTYLWLPSTALAAVGGPQLPNKPIWWAFLASLKDLSHAGFRTLTCSHSEAAGDLDALGEWCFTVLRVKKKVWGQRIKNKPKSYKAFYTSTFLPFTWQWHYESRRIVLAGPSTSSGALFLPSERQQCPHKCQNHWLSMNLRWFLLASNGWLAIISVAPARDAYQQAIRHLMFLF